MNEPWPGTFQVRCTLSYRIYPGPLQQVTLTTSVVIAQPTGVRIAGGLNTPTLIGQPIILTFLPQAGGQDCGPYYGGMAQEMVTNKVWFGVADPADDDKSWTPTLAQGPLAAFLKSGLYIYDTKTQGMLPQFANWPLFQPFNTVTQQVRMIYTDPCGVVRTYPVGTVKLARELTAPGVWQIIQQ